MVRNFWRLLLFAVAVSGLEYSDLLIVIFSQRNEYNIQQAQLLKSEVISQAKDDQKKPPTVILTHELDIFGAWTITPVIYYLAHYNISKLWYFFCSDSTAVRLNKLSKVLGKYKSETQKNLWVGYSQYDREPTITHHFAENTKKLKYPNLSSGFAVSKHLFNRLSEKQPDSSRVKFSIDACYEFAKFVMMNANGARLLHVPEFCTTENDICATYPKPVLQCSQALPVDKIYVAIKTCSKNHLDRVSAIKETWTKYATHIGYFTDKIDENLKDGILVPNTEHGHCAKTSAILKYVLPILKREGLYWLLIADDDTILSLSRLLKLLSCYNSNKALALGERYGYRTSYIHGYDYLTGGAGVVLSTSLVEQITRPNICDCPTASTPDDMFLFGVCLSQLGLQVVHSSQFHQVSNEIIIFILRMHVVLLDKNNSASWLKIQILCMLFIKRNFIFETKS